MCSVSNRYQNNHHRKMVRFLRQLTLHSTAICVRHSADSTGYELTIIDLMDTLNNDSDQPEVSLAYH